MKQLAACYAHVPHGRLAGCGLGAECGFSTPTRLSVPGLARPTRPPPSAQCRLNAVIRTPIFAFAFFGSLAFPFAVSSGRIGEKDQEPCSPSCAALYSLVVFA